MQQNHTNTISLHGNNERDLQRSEAPRMERDSANEYREVTHTNYAPNDITLVAKGVAFKRKQESAPKGHEAFLKALETSGASISIEKASSGAIIVGRVKHSDEFTVSVQMDSGITRVVFKHDISEFSAISPRPTQVAK